MAGPALAARAVTRHRPSSVTRGDARVGLTPHTPRPALSPPSLTRSPHLPPARRQAIAFEDSPSGITSAVAAGLLTVGVATGHPPATLLAAGAAFVIRDYYDERLATVLGLWLGEGARSAVLGAAAE